MFSNVDVEYIPLHSKRNMTQPLKVFKSTEFEIKNTVTQQDNRLLTFILNE